MLEAAEWGIWAQKCSKWHALLRGTSVPAGVGAGRAARPSAPTSSTEAHGTPPVDGWSSIYMFVAGTAQRCSRSSADGSPAQGEALARLQAAPFLGSASRRPLEWQAGWPVDALRIGWLCRLALLAHCWEHISGRSMSACRGAHYSRVQPLIQVEYEVGPRIGRSARVFCRSARPTCSLSPRVVSLQKCVWEAVQRGRMSMSPCESDVHAARYTYFLESEHFTSPRADLGDGF